LKLIYVAGPYHSENPHVIEENILKAKRAALECWDRGWAVICPHANTAGFERFQRPPWKVQQHTWIEGDIEILRRCDAIVMLPGWENSPGSRKEFEAAHLFGLTIYEDLTKVPIMRREGF
jgi:hypothetical protein